MGDEGRPDDTEIEVDNENIHICRKFCSNNRFPYGAENQPHDYDPDNNDDTLDNKRRNGSFEKSKFCDSPELEMPAISEGPEDEGRTNCSKRKGWADAEA